MPPPPMAPNLALGNASRLGSGRLVIAQSLPFRMRNPLAKLQAKKDVLPTALPPDKLALPDSAAITYWAFKWAHGKG